MHTKTMKGSKLSFPVTIILIGVIVALGVIVVRGNLHLPAKKSDTAPIRATNVTLTPIESNDHVLGNPNAPVTIIEYSDLGCPFCALFHETMQEVMRVYGEKGQVNWVYRHFANTDAHPLAREAAILGECVKQIHGEVAFWDYVDTVFDIQRDGGPNAILTDDTIDAALEPYGMTADSKALCLTYNNLASKVDSDHADGMKLAEKDPENFGTPYTILISPNGTTVELTEAISYSILSEYIDVLLLDR